MQTILCCNSLYINNYSLRQLLWGSGNYHSLPRQLGPAASLRDKFTHMYLDLESSHNWWIWVTLANNSMNSSNPYFLLFACLNSIGFRLSHRLACFHILGAIIDSSPLFYSYTSLMREAWSNLPGSFLPRTSI